MVKQAPKKESEFIEEIRAGLYEALPGLVEMHRNHTESGAPDALIVFWTQGRDSQGRIKLGQKEKCDEIWVEFKYCNKIYQNMRSLEEPWNLCRTNQKIALTSMAAAKMKVFLCVCYRGVEAAWYRINVAQAKKVLKGKAPPFSVLALEYNSIRTKEGKWTTGQDWGDLDLGPAPPSLRQRAMNFFRKNKRSPLIMPDHGISGLTKPRLTPYT